MSKFSEIAKSIFSEKALYPPNIHENFAVFGSYFFDNCDYIILDYSHDVLRIATGFVLIDGRVYVSDTNGFPIHSFEKYLNINSPTEKQFIEESYKLYKRIKEFKSKLKLEDIKEDF